ncbi:MAG: LysM peptidoglycan-binding domain-containing protein [Chloroflexi bacterium]|nr:MAG: LysM peptidoglycan-binding domain-containing protein [Chloroflexota bacterium]
MTFPRRRLAGSLLALALGLAACVSDATPTIQGNQQPARSGSASSSASATPTIPPETTAAPETPAPSLAGTLYWVVAGDTLASIARRYSTSVEQLQAWNASRYPSLASEPGTLIVGWQLVVAGVPGVTPLPTPTPRASSPTAASCHAGDRAPATPRAVYRSIPGGGAEVALTFDMGGRLDPALQIMSFLVANRVCATIFPTGAMGQTAMGRQVLAVIRAHPELFEIGNHTMYHCDLVHGGLGSPTTAPCAGGTPSAAFIRKELTDAAAILKAATGQDPTPYWRPPYGTYNQAVLDAAASVGYTKTLLWDIDTIDWKPIADGGPTAQQIANKVVGGALNGSVVLMHLGGYETLQALHLMVPGLRQRGFTLTSISDQLDG